jgi:hypothetical protein
LPYLWAIKRSSLLFPEVPEERERGGSPERKKAPKVIDIGKFIVI